MAEWVTRWTDADDNVGLETFYAYISQFHGVVKARFDYTHNPWYQAAIRGSLEPDQGDGFGYPGGGVTYRSLVPFRGTDTAFCVRGKLRTLFGVDHCATLMLYHVDAPEPPPLPTIPPSNQVLRHVLTSGYFVGPCYSLYNQAAFTGLIGGDGGGVDAATDEWSEIWWNEGVSDVPMPVNRVGGPFLWPATLPAKYVRMFTSIDDGVTWNMRCNVDLTYLAISPWVWDRFGMASWRPQDASHGGCFGQSFSFLSYGDPPAPVVVPQPTISCAFGGGQFGVSEPPYGLCLTSVVPGNPPFLDNQIPAPSATNVLINSQVLFDVLDDSEGIDLSTLVISIEGNLAWSGGTFQAPFSGPPPSPIVVDGYDGYHLEISHSVNFPYNSFIDVHVVVEDFNGDLLDTTYIFLTVPNPPVSLLSLTQGPYEITLDVEFSGPMLLSSLTDASSFVFSNGAFVRYVEPLPLRSLVPTGVRLWVEKFIGDSLFTLTIASPPVLDTFGNTLDPIGRSATISPFQSSAVFSNTNGLIRSWHESHLITYDTQRIYLSSIRGLDVFDARSGFSTSNRWAQILDSYGISALCLTSSGDGYDFSDGISPQVFNQLPLPNSIVLSPDVISFSIVDSITSVEITSLAVYINSILVFSGITGWENNWGGKILVHPQQLDIELYPPVVFSSGTLISVHILANDLLGNLTNIIYTFTIAP
jgi:hypothetical protein